MSRNSKFGFVDTKPKACTDVEQRPYIFTIDGDELNLILTRSDPNTLYDVDWDNDGIYDNLNLTGTIRHNYTSGKEVLNNKIINLTWISGHAPSSHSYRKPKVGEQIIIKSDHPHGDEEGPFNLYVYYVKENENSWDRDTLVLALTEIKQTKFNKEKECYEWYVKEESKCYSYFKRKFFGK